MEPATATPFSLHKTELAALYKKFKEYCELKDPFFHLSSSDHGTLVFTHKDAATGTKIIKSEKLISAPLESIFNLLIIDEEAEKEWDTACEDVCIYGLEEEARYIYGYYPIKEQGLVISPRDFAFVTTYYQEENGDTYIVTKSYKDPEIPVFKGIVRCDLFLMGYGLFPVSPNETLVKFVLHIDYGGSVPKFIFNMMASYMGDSVNLISKYLEKKIPKTKMGKVWQKKDVVDKFQKKK